MRKVEYWVAWDDSEFDTEEECREYEWSILNILRSIDRCYTFFNKDKLPIFPPNSDDLETWVDWLCMAVDTCTYIRIWTPLSRDAVCLINREWGYCINPEDFPAATGFFKYDTWRNAWVEEVDE